MADDFGAQADKLASAMKWGQEHASSAMRGTVDPAKAAYNAAKSFRTGEIAGEPEPESEREQSSSDSGAPDDLVAVVRRGTLHGTTS